MASVSHTKKTALEFIMKSTSDGIDLSTPQNRPSIYRVHEHLRDLNDKAYEPQIVAIGPYHRGKEHLKMMEEHKWRYLKSLLLRVPSVEIESYISVVGKREEEARNCYAESVSLDRDKFIEMLVLDGCFIVELIIKWSLKYSVENDPIFQTLWIMDSLRRDMMLFENQIPFFILADFLYLIFKNNIRPVDFVLVYFENLHPGKDGSNMRKSESVDVKHILDLLHINWSQYSSINLESSAGAVERNHWTKRILDLLHCNWSNSSEDATAEGDDGTNNCGFQKSILSLLHCNWTIKVESDTANSESSPFIHSASELRDSNVKFQMKKSNNLFGVEFAKGTMSMAPLKFEDTTECVFRNLIAYEQYFSDTRQTPFTDYHKLLDCLINSSTDVEILCQCKIIENWLGDNEAVVEIVNRLGDSIVMGTHFPYAKTFNDINTHCQRCWNRAIAKLKRDYFNSPWAYISFIAALVLLLLTIAQTVLAAIQLP